jgi:hypothetical protein
MRGALLSVVLSGCTCFHPVYEALDAGEEPLDAGPDASVPRPDGGECSVPAHCSRPGPATSLCPYFQRDGGFSCIDRTCTYECLPNRTCSTDAGCLSCDTGGSCESGASCGQTAAAAIESDNGCPGGLMDLTLTPIAGHCGWTVSDTATGRVIGTIYRLQDGTYLAHLDDYGGACTGTSLFTQVERWMFSCPACQFEIRL